MHQPPVLLAEVLVILALNQHVDVEISILHRQQGQALSPALAVRFSEYVLVRWAIECTYSVPVFYGAENDTCLCHSGFGIGWM